MTALIRSESPQPYKLIATRPVTHDTKAFRFELPPGARLDYLPGDCVTITATIDGEEVERPYTPCLPPWTEGYFELTIKRYEQGKMSKHIHDDVQIGDSVMIAGPWPGGHYTQGMARRIGMVAGGTGITPMLSIIRTIMVRGDAVGVSLLFANKEERDIICREEFDKYSQSDNFKAHYALERAPEEWKGFVGRVTREMMSKVLPLPGDDRVVFLCGPKPMQETLRGQIRELGHAEKRIIEP